jgi:hypothetical protein
MAGRRLFTVYRANGKRELVTEKDLFDLVLIVGDRDSIYGADYYHEGVHLQYYYNAKKETWYIRRPKHITEYDFKDYMFDDIKKLVQESSEVAHVFKNRDMLVIREFAYANDYGVVLHGYNVIYRALEISRDYRLKRQYTHHLPQYWTLNRLDDAVETFIGRTLQGIINRPLPNSMSDLFKTY